MTKTSTLGHYFLYFFMSLFEGGHIAFQTSVGRYVGLQKQLIQSITWERFTSYSNCVHWYKSMSRLALRRSTVLGRGHSGQATYFGLRYLLQPVTREHFQHGTLETCQWLYDLYCLTGQRSKVKVTQVGKRMLHLITFKPCKPIHIGDDHHCSTDQWAMVKVTQAWQLFQSTLNMDNASTHKLQTWYTGTHQWLDNHIAWNIGGPWSRSLRPDNLFNL